MRSDASGFASHANAPLISTPHRERESFRARDATGSASHANAFSISTPYGKRQSFRAERRNAFALHARSACCILQPRDPSPLFPSNPMAKWTLSSRAEGREWFCLPCANAHVASRSREIPPRFSHQSNGPMDVVVPNGGTRMVLLPMRECACRVSQSRDPSYLFLLVYGYGLQVFRQ